MKKIILTCGLCLIVAGCETAGEWVDGMSLSSLNPFSSEETAQGNETVQGEKVVKPLPARDSSALNVELEEMARLTGDAPRFDHVIEEPVVEGTANFDEQILKPLAAEKPVKLVNIPTPLNKPAAPTVENVVEPMQVVQQVIEAPKPSNQMEETAKEVASKAVETVKEEVKTNVEPIKPIVEPVKDVVIPEPTPAPAPVSAPEPVKPQPVEAPVEVKAQPAKAVEVTDETPMFRDGDLKLTTEQGCPKVQIMSAGRSITYFENDMSGPLVARASITEIRGGCEYKADGVEIDLDILMKGHITPKGRFEGKIDQEAFMTFPYFVAVTDPQGLPVDKQILATAMRFRPHVDDLSHAEKITQFVPIRDVSQGANYNITVGYQLTRKQLEYNRAQTLSRVNNVRVAPDLRNKSRVSVDPLAGE